MGKEVHLNKEASNSYFIHETAWVDNNVEIGAGTKIWHVSHILKNSKIGKKCNIGQNVVIGPNAVIGNNCKIQNNVSIYKGITLEDDVFCGPSMVFMNVLNPRSAIPRMDELKRTLVKKGATLGANATIICGITIGQHAFIGAGAVVTKDVLAYELVKGNPARVAGWMCECGIKLKFENVEGDEQDTASCKACNKAYLKEMGVVKQAKSEVAQRDISF